MCQTPEFVPRAQRFGLEWQFGPKKCDAEGRNVPKAELETRELCRAGECELGEEMCVGSPGLKRQRSVYYANVSCFLVYRWGDQFRLVEANLEATRLLPGEQNGDTRRRVHLRS